MLYLREYAHSVVLFCIHEIIISVLMEFKWSIYIFSSVVPGQYNGACEVALLIWVELRDTEQKQISNVRNMHLFLGNHCIRILNGNQKKKHRQAEFKSNQIFYT